MSRFVSILFAAFALFTFACSTEDFPVVQQQNDGGGNIGPTCSDGIKNDGESGTDCGGTSTCSRCGVGATCMVTTDCATGSICSSGVCASGNTADTTPPTIGISTATGQTITTLPFQFNGTSGDNVSVTSVFCANAGVGANPSTVGTTTWTATATNLASGQNQFVCHAFDTAGNKSAPVFINVTYNPPGGGGSDGGTGDGGTDGGGGGSDGGSTTTPTAFTAIGAPLSATSGAVNWAATPPVTNVTAQCTSSSGVATAVLSAGSGTSGSVTFTGLQVSTYYSCAAWATDGVGNRLVYNTQFTTLQSGGSSTVSLFDTVVVSAITPTTVSVGWTASAALSAVVVQCQPAVRSTGAATSAVQGNLAVEGLTPSTSYSCTVAGVDAEGRTVTSTGFSFRTLAQASGGGGSGVGPSVVFSGEPNVTVSTATYQFVVVVRDAVAVLVVRCAINGRYDQLLPLTYTAGGTAVTAVGSVTLEEGVATVVSCQGISSGNLVGDGASITVTYYSSGSSSVPPFKFEFLGGSPPHTTLNDVAVAGMAYAGQGNTIVQGWCTNTAPNGTVVHYNATLVDKGGTKSMSAVALTVHITSLGSSGANHENLVSCSVRNSAGAVTSSTSYYRIFYDGT